MSEHINPDPYDSARFFHGIRSTASALAVPFDDALVRKTLDVFDAELGCSVVQLKATSKPGGGLYYRFWSYEGESDLIGIAQRHGLLHLGDAPTVALQRELLDKIPEAAKQDGLDFDTSFGLAKTWTRTKGRPGRPIEELFDLTSIPDAIRAHAGFFARHGLRRNLWVASCYQNETVNIYPVVEPDCRNVDWLRRLVEETGGASDDTPGYAEMIASLGPRYPVCLGMTFSWNSPEMGSWALYAMNVPYLDTQAGATLPTLPPRLKTFLDQASKIKNRPQAQVAWTFGKAGFYTKLAVGDHVVSRSKLA